MCVIGRCFSAAPSSRVISFYSSVLASSLDALFSALLSLCFLLLLAAISLHSTCSGFFLLRFFYVMALALCGLR